jgi:hypothetical protein
MAHDPLLMGIVVRHRGPLNRQQLASRPSNSSRLREIRDETIPCDMCNGGGCRYCEGSGKLQRWPHLISEVFQVSSDDWALEPEAMDPEYRRKAVLKQLWARFGDEHVGYPEEFYASKDTYREDAGLCYQRHRRPGSEKGPDGCLDYQAGDKRLTDSHWRERHPEQGDVYLCDFCVYKSVVTTRMRMQRGDYD